MEVAIRSETICNNFLQNFPEAFEEGDRAVGFRYRVVRFVWFGNDDNFSFCPRVVTKAEGGGEDVEDELGLCGEGPFHQFVANSGGTRGGFVGRVAQGGLHLPFRNLVEGATGCGATW